MPAKIFTSDMVEIFGAKGMKSVTKVRIFDRWAKVNFFTEGINFEIYPTQNQTIFDFKII